MCTSRDFSVDARRPLLLIIGSVLPPYGNFRTLQRFSSDRSVIIDSRYSSQPVIKSAPMVPPSIRLTTLFLLYHSCRGKLSTKAQGSQKNGPEAFRLSDSIIAPRVCIATSKLAGRSRVALAGDADSMSNLPPWCRWQRPAGFE